VNHGVIYVATNTETGKQYVGLTTVGVARRWSNHITHSRTPKTYLHKAIAKYGASAFCVEEYVSAIKREVLAQLEKDVILQLVPAYNQTCGGEVTFGRKYDDATKEQIRLSNTGKKRTTEQREAARQKKLDWFAKNPEQKEITARKLAEARLLVDEEKRKIATGNSSRNRVWSSESKAKLSASCKGRRYGPEVISKMAETKKRKILCDTTGIVYSCRTEAAKHSGISERSIQRVCGGEYSSVKGLKFSYIG
jgi:group I intron endonuclease